VRLIGQTEKDMEALEHDFAQIVREHKGTIYTVCYMFSQNEEEVADLFQDILVNLWNGFRKFRGDSSHNTWIYRVSLNTCISAERKKKRKGETIPLDMNINLFDDSGEDLKQIRMLQERISRLGPFDRAIVLLWLENMSYDEIGNIVGISAKNVSVRLFRIKEQLKKMSNQ
jgi:RNA polymerase sigma-70 factor (ECF subfamily)